MLQIVLNKLQSKNDSLLINLIEKHKRRWDLIFTEILEDIDYQVNLRRCKFPGCQEYKLFVDSYEMKSNHDTRVYSCEECDNEGKLIGYYCASHTVFTGLVD